ncbi:MAG: sigma-54-dependent Fis family transcriptional regulator, partial [Planctomycetes bacterium]|nr:sigma-54-dependent Fis family transcriptional regulator [Planctomycetota bacterium]
VHPRRARLRGAPRGRRHARRPRRLAAPVANSRLHADSLAEKTRLRRQIESLSARFQFDNILGESPLMRKLFHAIERVAATDLPVLIHGPSGAGKELIARAIHFNGPRREKAFVAENCGALANTLLESELFGHVKGSFTGANADREGLFAMANGGTLFLDEVGEMSVDLQKKLLRVLQEGEVRPVGAMLARKVNVRIVTATHRNLRELVADGKFREDLFYRLGVVELKVPSLADRREDIPLLARSFLDEAARATPIKRRRFADETLRLLCEYDWPGNVRELQNEVRKLAALGGEVLTPENLSPALRALRVQPARPKTGLKDKVGAMEEEVIKKALEANGWNIRKTAPLLGMNRMSLARRMKKYGLAPPEKE